MPGSSAFTIRPWVLWVGPARDADLRLARLQVGRIAVVADAVSPREAAAGSADGGRGGSPAVILLASPTPATWSLADVIAVRLAWPLAAVVSVAAGLVDGRRRSGPALAGVEEVPWHDLPGRLAWWLADRAAGRPGTLGLPPTVRREERFLEGPRAALAGPPPRLVVAAQRPIDLEAACDLVAAAGGSVVQAVRGRPPLTAAADAILWDVATPGDADLPWLRMLLAERPTRRVIVLDSFPRADRVGAMLRAGAAAVLGRPGSAEAVAGVLAGPAIAPGIGLGGVGPSP
ncbi:MAG: hypothetical protein RLZZ440_2188 [Planctomycetota bacterium]